MEATKINGHIINIGRLAGMNGDFDYDLHAKRRLNYIGTTGRTRSIEENEKRLLRNALVRAGGNRTKAAELMGVSRRTLHRKLDRWPELDVREQ